MFLYTTVSSSLDPSNFKDVYTSPPGRPFHSNTNSTPRGSINPITARLLFIHIIPSLSIASYSFIQLSELGHHGENENVQASKWQESGFEPGPPLFIVQHSTVEQPCST